ncbi:protein kinase [Candidatus Woesearchaeota archaeon]|nr:protein kinase [Candidatus Woesearchaeota archaeon]
MRFQPFEDHTTLEATIPRLERRERAGRHAHDTHAPHPFLKQELIEFLTLRGYTLIDDGELGKEEGHTSKVYLANYASGKYNALRVLKIPLAEIPGSSFTTILNLSKGNVYQNEVHFGSVLSHPNIIDVVEHLEFEGTDIVAEQYFKNAKSLESLVKQSGPIRDTDRFYQIFRQYIEGAKHLVDNGILHRDHKPSNMLVNDQDLVKIIDLQNCKRIEEIEHEFYPTRGGTPFTHPTLINALMLGKEAKADLRTEIYSIVATMYYALVGESPIEYTLKTGEKGVTRTVGGINYFVTLLKGDEPIGSIDHAIHEQEVERAARRVPRQYRTIIRKGLTLDGDKGYWSIDQLISDLEKTRRPTTADWLNKAKESLRMAAGVAAGVGVFGLVVMGSIWTGNQKEPRPSLFEVMRNERYMEWSRQNLSDPERRYMWSVIADDAKLLRERYEDVSRQYGKDAGRHGLEGVFEDLGNFVESIHGMDRRLMLSVLRAAYIADKEDLPESYRKARTPQMLVPRIFVRYADELTHGMAADDDNINVQSAFATKYMKLCMDPDRDVVETIVRYFCDFETEIAPAMQRSGDVRYLPYIVVDDTTKGAFTVNEGYYRYLPAEKQRLIDDAIALYEMTDEEGKVRWDRMPKLIPNLTYSPEYRTTHYQVVMPERPAATATAGGRSAGLKPGTGTVQPR